MMRFIWISFLSLLFSLPMLAPGQSSGGASGRQSFIQKSERKAESRWTLQGWLEQRDKNRMMDLWLAMNSPSPYEFFLSGAYQDYQTKLERPMSESKHNSGLYGFGAYSGIMGLEAFHENNLEENQTQNAGSLNIRIIGNAVQGTHLILGYGYRSMNLTDNNLTTNVNQSFANVDVNLYFTRFFGLSGMYRYYVPAETTALGTVSGYRTEAGAFLDFSFLRFFGAWYSDNQTLNPSLGEKNIERTGIMSGLKIFF